MGIFTGYPSLMAAPGKHEHYVYAGPLNGLFIVLGGLAGALIGSVVGAIIHSARKIRYDEGTK